MQISLIMLFNLTKLVIEHLLLNPIENIMCFVHIMTEACRESRKRRRKHRDIDKQFTCYYLVLKFLATLIYGTARKQDGVAVCTKPPLME